MHYQDKIVYFQVLICISVGVATKTFCISIILPAMYAAVTADAIKLTIV
jgi:hypothetical protein